MCAPLLRLVLAADPDARPDCSTLLQHPVVLQLSRLLAERDARVPYQLASTLNRAGGCDHWHRKARVQQTNRDLALLGRAIERCGGCLFV